jgi:diguanylate cyclase (GGDEF)-like protein
MPRVTIDHNRYTFARVTFVVGLFVLPIIAYNDFQNHYYASFVAKLITIGIVALGLTYSFSKDKQDLSGRLAAISLFAMSVVGALTKQELASAVVWVPVLPMLFLFLADLRTGLILSGMYLAMFVLGYLLHPHFYDTPRLVWHEWIQSVLAYLVATLFAVLYELSRLSNEKMLRIEADFDHLTGVLNRRGVMAFVDKEVQRIERYNGNFCILLFDIDNFKSINDRYGHDVGDEVLKKLARDLQSRMRRTDCFGRWGGEEFIVVVPAIELEDAVMIAEVLRRVIPTLDVGVAGSITASFGVAQMQPGNSVETVIQTADRALYLAKHRGKDQVCYLLGDRQDNDQYEMPFVSAIAEEPGDDSGSRGSAPDAC